MALDLEGIVSIIDKLIKLLDEKKSKDERETNVKEVNSKIREIVGLTLEMNELNAQLPPDLKEVKKIQDAKAKWKQFEEFLRQFEVHHSKNEDKQASDKLSQAKVYLRQFKKIVEEIFKEKDYKLRRQKEKQEEEKNKKNNKK